MLGMRALTDDLTRSPSADGGELLYIGSYTEDGRVEGLYLARLDTGTGALRQLGQVDAGRNPSFLAIHPNGRTLYAVNEVTDYGGKSSGAVTALAIAADTGALTKLNEQPSMGSAPCYVSVDRSGVALLVANYLGGNVAMLRIRQNGALDGDATVVDHRGTGPDKERQEAPHAHCIIPDPSNRYALAADLGADRVFVYELDAERKSIHAVDDAGGVAKPGAGPRHLTFHPRLPLVYVANELDSTVSTLRFDRDRGKLSSVDIRSTLPAEWQGTNYPADIHLSRSARTLYVSNRGHNSLALFAIDAAKGTLTPQGTFPTGGTPRNFKIDPTGDWVITEGQNVNKAFVQKIDRPTGKVTMTDVTMDVPAPVCIVFV